MASLKLKVAVASFVVIGAGTLLTLQQLKVNELRGENTFLRGQMITSEAPTTSAQPPPKSPAQQPVQDQNELLRLRGEVNQLRGKVASMRTETTRLQEADSLRERLGTELQIERTAGAPFAPNHYYARELWSDVGLDAPEAVLQTALAAVTSGNLERMIETLNLSESERAGLLKRWSSDALREFPGASAIGVKVMAFGGTLNSPKIEYILEFDNGQTVPASKAHFTLDNIDGKWRMRPNVDIEGPGDGYVVPK
jgi:hypothetical protein